MATLPGITVELVRLQRLSQMQARLQKLREAAQKYRLLHELSPTSASIFCPQESRRIAIAWDAVLRAGG